MAPGGSWFLGYMAPTARVVYSAPMARYFLILETSTDHFACYVHTVKPRVSILHAVCTLLEPQPVHFACYLHTSGTSTCHCMLFAFF